MTLQGWADIMFITQDTVGYASFLYFVILVFIGPIYTHNFVCAYTYIYIYAHTHR
jgi:hypothetical protein